MFLTAHCILHENLEYDHFFLYEHTDNKFIIDHPGNSFHVGNLKKQHTKVFAGGNSVLSFLDIICPEGTTTDQIQKSFKECIEKKKLTTPNMSKWNELGWYSLHVDIIPTDSIPPKVPCEVSGGDDNVWFFIAAEPKRGFWFDESARLLNGLIECIDKENWV